MPGAQSQLVCSGCRNLLMYPVGATSVCCAVCNAVTAVPPPGMMQFLLTESITLYVIPLVCMLCESCVISMTGTEMAQLVCGGCHTLLMYIRGATNVQCSCCHTVNLALEGILVLMFKELCMHDGENLGDVCVVS